MKRILYRMFLIVLGFFVAACAVEKKIEKYVSDTGSIVAQAEWPDDLPSDLVTVRMIISASDMKTISQYFEFSDRSGVIYEMRGIPVGDNRTVILEGLNSDYKRLYEGSVTNITVASRQTADCGVIVTSEVISTPKAPKAVPKAPPEVVAPAPKAVPKPPPEVVAPTPKAVPKAPPEVVEVEVARKPTKAARAPKLTPDEILIKADQIRAPGKNFVIEMTITSKKGEEETVNKVMLRVKDYIKSLIIYKYPASQKGRVILMVENNMWIYFPGTKRPIRISPAQQMLGQVSNADVARVVYNLDYEAESVEDDTIGNKKLLKMALKAKSKGAAYGSINLWLNKDSFQLVKAEFFTLAGRLLKTIYYKGYKKIHGKVRPTIHEVHDAIKKSEITIMEYTTWKIKDTSDNYFQKTFMQRISIMNP